MTASAKSPSGARLLLVVLALTALLFAGAAFVPAGRLWGINHLVYWPVPWRLAAIAVIALAFVPVVSDRLHRWLLGIVASLEQGRRAGLIIGVVAVVAVGVFFWGQSASLLLGDGHVIGATFDRSLAAPEAADGLTVGKILREKHIEPGAAILYLVGGGGLARLTGGTGADGIRLFNCLLGGFFVLTLLLVVRRGELPAVLKAWLLILGLTSGAVQLFCGYVEYYAPVILCGTFYVIAAWRVAHGRGSIWGPAVLALVCVFLHIQAVLLLPSLVLLLVWRLRPQPTKLRTQTLLLGAVTLAAFGAAYAVPQTRAYLLPLFRRPDSPGLIDLVHGLDLLNELVLLLPLIFVFVVMALQARRTPSPTAARDDTGMTPPLAWSFTGLLVWPALLFLVLFDPAIGMARDWDLFALLSLGLVPAGLLLLNRYRYLAPAQMPRLTGPALVLAGVMTTAWIGVNASPVRSADRFAAILEFESSRSDYAWETLARHYQQHGRFAEAIAAQHRAVAVSSNPRQVVNLSVMYRDGGDAEQAKQVLRDLLAKRPEYFGARRTLILLLMTDKEFGEGAEVARRGIEIDPQLGGYHYFYGKNLLLLGNLDKGEQALREALRLGVPAHIGAEIQKMLAALPGMRNASP